MSRRWQYWEHRLQRAQALTQWGRPRRAPRPYVHDEPTFLFTPRRALKPGPWTEYDTMQFSIVVPDTWWTPTAD